MISKNELINFLRTLYQKLPPNRGLAHFFNIQEEAFLSFLMDISGLQESILFRGFRRAHILASLLIDEQGNLSQSLLIEWIDLFEKEGHLFYADGLNDSVLTEHMLMVLKALRERSELIKKLKRFQKPLCHPWAEELVRYSLGIYLPTPITDQQIRIAVLSALLTPLRQSVGSCFATAPAIVIQRQQLENLIDDLYQLLTTGKLKRIFGGVEYAVPLSPSAGIGDLRKPLQFREDQSRVWLSPALMRACEVAGLIPEGLSWEEKGEKLKKLISSEQGDKVGTVESFLHRVLLESYGLTDHDLEVAERSELIRARSSQRAHPLTPIDPSKKGELALKLGRMEKLARAAFRGFCDHALLKAWEFTLASFSEVKMEFSRWNLYSSLGLNNQEQGGIGAVIYRHLEEKIGQSNELIHKYQNEYEIAFDQVRGTEAMMKNASSNAEVRRLQAEYQSRVYHMRACLEMRDKSYTIGSNYSSLYAFLIKQYDEKFPEYFQEIYDAEMQDVQGDLYDDSPAGFRLVYKHGRNDPALWTLIYTPEQYIEALVEFFNATESEIAGSCDWEGGDKEILEITSAIVLHIRTPFFLDTALQRMAKAHLEVGSFLKLAEKKPWVYTSGGTMTTLLKTSYCRQGELTGESRWAENETDLLIFLIDAVKNQSSQVIDPYGKNPYFGMLMTSPSHAFILQPGFHLYKEGWQEQGFTYTWVRDQVFSPSHQFYAKIRLGIKEQELLIDLFSEELPPFLSHHLQRRFSPSKDPVGSVPFRKAVLDCLPVLQEAQQRAIADKIDAFLYQTLPIVPGREFKLIMRRLFADRFDQKLEKALMQFPDVPAPLMTAKMVKDAAKACWIRAYEQIGYPIDIHQYIADHARFIALSAPTPLLFADTNWANFYFGFVVNPGTGRLELWRLDRTASEGMPMSSWQHWINGTDRKPWSVYVRPAEYSGHIPN